jgi:putative DNA-invertase from lambdoid prophage Rac
LGTRPKKRAPARKSSAQPVCAWDGCVARSVTCRFLSPGIPSPVCEKHRDAFDAKTVRRDPRNEKAMAIVRAELASRPRAAIYLRVSTDEQTVENQRPDVERMLAVRELELVELFAENVSAAAKARPAFDRMMEGAKRGRFKVLAIWSLDRFGRSMVGNMNAVRELDRLGVRVVSAREDWLDTTGPVRELLIAIFSWVAEQERVRLGERTRAGMARARATGKSIGRPRARIDPNELDMLAREYGLLSSGRSVRGYTGRRATKAQLARRLGVSEATLRRELARRRASGSGFSNTIEGTAQNSATPSDRRRSPPSK